MVDTIVPQLPDEVRLQLDSAEFNAAFQASPSSYSRCTRSCSALSAESAEARLRASSRRADACSMIAIIASVLASPLRPLTARHLARSTRWS